MIDCSDGGYNKMEIRYMNEKDDPYDISNVYEKSWKYAYKGIIPQNFLDNIPKGNWIKSLKAMKNLVMIESGVIIGTSGFGPSRWDDYKDFGEIISIYLLPEFTGKGYGSKLLNRSIEELKKDGFDKIILWVLEENHIARKFYEKNKFTKCDNVRADIVGEKKLTEIMYILEI